MEKVKERDGFSLMEMIIVIAIVGTLTGGIAISYNMVRRPPPPRSCPDRARA